MFLERNFELLSPPSEQNLDIFWNHRIGAHFWMSARSFLSNQDWQAQFLILPSNLDGVFPDFLSPEAIFCPSALWGRIERSVLGTKRVVGRQGHTASLLHVRPCSKLHSKQIGCGDSAWGQVSISLITPSQECNYVEIQQLFLKTYSREL